MAIVGIDLGTTNSLVAVWTASGPELIPNAHGDLLTPSVVSVVDGEALVGRAASERLITRPQATVAAFKRWMGTDKLTRLDGRPFRAEELSALVLGSLKRDAEAHLGEAITEAVISVPAYFNDLQRKATMTAARLAGLHVERLVNEPTAAALAYGLGEVEEAQFLVFDLGGGTFDVSILDKYDQVMEVRATAGDNYLGGDDFRDLLMAHLAERHGLDRTKLAAGDLSRFTRFAESLKIELSAKTTVAYTFELPGQVVEGRIERSEYEEVVRPLLRRLRTPLERAISDARLDPREIAQVVMVGGATRMPAVRSLVGRLFARLPLTHLNPDHLVALGAAVQAGLKARHAALDDVVMTDVCPYTLGIAALSSQRGSGGEPVTVPIIERNSVVPISRSHPFTTVQDNQTQIRLEVYQGENLKPENNVNLGALEVEVTRAKAGHETVEVRFTYDLNGALELEATVQSTGKVWRRVFQNRTGLSDAEIDKRFSELAALKLPPREQAPNRLLIERAERIYAESLGERRELVSGALREFMMAIQDPTNAHPDRDREAFAKLLDRFETDVFRDID
ncbi:molecular chaperone HscC [Prosthecomicrobium hirschii]|uniref:molecular chaperone HscC n=1 Tax=Prosthecodimorpha hirschii TaxID=665126 RepID=UPI0011282EF9|nr:molecular chaperone HscC [Prosthecomicrobium hirschii]TPQ47836.1 molecular chaperone HscC [Prosthecomicrobium hirschii]